MKIAVVKEYNLNKVGVDIMDVEHGDLPIDVALGMVSHELKRLPNSGEVIALGKDGQGMSARSVLVFEVTGDQAQAIQAIYQNGEELDDQTYDAIELAKSFMPIYGSCYRVDPRLTFTPCYQIVLEKGDRVKVRFNDGEMVEGVVTSVVQPRPSEYSDIENGGAVYVRLPYKERTEVFSFPPNQVWKINLP